MTHCTALARPDGEQFLFFYNGENKTDRLEIYKALGRMASSPDINLTWMEAGRMAVDVRRSADRAVPMATEPSSAGDARGWYARGQGRAE